jgi:uncharacterized protein (TIGR02118 family)
MVKSLSLLVRKDGMTHEQFMKHWVEIHAPLALEVPGLRRYVQSHIQEGRRRPDIPDIGVAVDGIAETWYDDAEAMARAIATPQMRALHADGARFIGRIQTFVVHEHVVIPTP